ncbi:NAD(+) synthase [Rhodovarius lipocyclicus]|uniref:NAD(+) synthase n=1 Tax=Rhodovarius lipocyclicus TaxID=268410 RepID=UPI00135AF168|nr:NAD(+) synthase [Rhodovarius lipocyclicus]
MSLPFDNLYRHGFVRAALCAPLMALAHPAANARASIAMARDASARGARVVLFPEMGLCGYSIEDLLLQTTLLDAVEAALAEVAAASREIPALLILGAPLRQGSGVFNCAVAIQAGRILAAIPKTYLPNYREFYEKRQIAPASTATAREITIAGQAVPFGTDILLPAEDNPDAVVHVEICEDLWTPIPPSSRGALAGGTILCNLSGSPVTVGKAEDRRALADAQSRRAIAAYLYAAAGAGESTTDLAWDGQLSAFEYGELLGEGARFSDRPEMLLVDIDVERLVQERRRVGSFRDAGLGEALDFRRIPFRLDPPAGALPLLREIPRFPYVPARPEKLDQDCYETWNIQVSGLMTRLRSTGLKKLVIGVSGGLDSTQALIVAARTMDRLGLPRANIIGVTLPGFATSAGTKSSAWALMKGLGVDAREVDIRPLATQLLKDLDHPYSAGQNQYDVTFENVQAGLRTDYLFRLANHSGGLVVGTGDLSELALGWCTYGVGDHMSHYNVNASLPKTLIQHMIRWVIGTGLYGPDVCAALETILGTEISPELVPPGADGVIQSTQAIIGPYELQDFHLFHTLRWGFSPGKVAFLALSAWGDAARGAWPRGIEGEDRHSYALPTIKHWLRVFLRRFFGQSQFKRSAVPNAPKISSGGSLSPRGDWRAPSDGLADAWLEALEREVPDV